MLYDSYKLGKKSVDEVVKEDPNLIPLPVVKKRSMRSRSKNKISPYRYLPITKGFIINRCGLSPGDFKAAFIEGDLSAPGMKECIQKQLNEIISDYNSEQLDPIYLMCTKKALAAYLGITTTALNKYFKGEGVSLNIKIEPLLTYDDQWNISRLSLPA